MGVVLLLRRAVGVAAAAQPSQVAVELRPDVPQLVQHGGEFLAEGEVEEPRQVEVEDVEHLAAVGVVEPLHAPAALAAEDVHPPAGEPQRRQRGIHPLAAGPAGLGETDRHPRHVHVPELIEPGDHILAEPPHVEREIEARLRRIARRLCFSITPE